ncbi:hypothetical protein [Lysobacter tyrosinilyticus]
MSFPTDSLLASLALAATAIASILGTGLAAAHALSRGRLQGASLLAYGGAAGVVVQALIGLVTVCLPFAYHATALTLLIAINVLAWLYWWRRGVYAALRHDGAFAPAAPFVAWLALVTICIGISHVPVKFPEPLFDPLYVIKNHNLHVKVQTITGHLPPDNYVPYAVEEFLLRDIQLAEERPLLPGQEVSNRPILMALAALPYRAAIDPPPKFQGRLPTFEFSGRSWPDASVLGADRYFRQFLVIGIVLNAMFLLSAGLLFREAGLSRRYLLAGLVLLVTSPYYLNQTLFTWPKALGAFFVVLSVHALMFRRWWAVGGALAALAYLSHPYAIVFAGSFGLYVALRNGIRRIDWAGATQYAAAFLVLVLPWLLWSRFYLDIPSDLVEQNIGPTGNWLQVVWARLQNAYTTLMPGYFSMQTLDPDQFVQHSLVSLTGIVGLFFFAQCYAGVAAAFRTMTGLVLCGVLIPATLLICVFGIPAVPALHGFQAVAPLVLLLGLKFMQERWSQRTLAVLLLLQLLLSALMVYARAVTLGL